jgi:hypothetical protein
MSDSPYEPKPLPGMEYQPQGYEPRRINQDDFLKSQLHYQIYKKQRQSDLNI